MFYGCFIPVLQSFYPKTGPKGVKKGTERGQKMGENERKRGEKVVKDT